MNARLKQEFVDELERLTPAERGQVLDYIRSLKRTKRGVRGSSVLRFAGRIPKDDLERMRQVIEEDFERVHEWS